jgi:NitT/TauT family transport system permease protein
MARTTGISKYVPRYVQRRVQSSTAYLILFIAIMAFVVGVYKGGVHLAQLTPETITLQELPSALALSFMRMTLSYAACLIFSFALGLLAARSALGERIIIPLLDILQSIPVIGFFPAAITFFIMISNGHRLGVEAAAIFLIFTSQAWNMAFAVYEATKTIPQDNMDAIASFGVRGSRRFWRLYAPACVPRLVYNSILSWSNGWYFLVACEIIAIGNIHYNLPGIGSFLSRAAEQDQLHLIFWGLIALSTLILSIDLLVWRPASVWAEKFRQDYSYGAEASPQTRRMFSFKIIRRIRPLRAALLRLIRALIFPIEWIIKQILMPLVWDLPAAILKALSQEIYSRFAIPMLKQWSRIIEGARWTNLVLLWTIGAIIGIWAGRALLHWLQPPWPAIAREIPMAILASTARLVIALFISLAWILPVVLFSWNIPRLRQALTTIAQVGASLPAVALFPLFIILAVKRIGGGMELASILLLLTGMQWYILFNGLGGTAIIPGDLALVTRGFGLKRIQTWRRLVLPAMRPALITGLITAWGGGWNALVVSEYVIYKNEVHTVNGIGALLNRAVYQLGDNRAITLCIAAMVGWIILINILVWRPLYVAAAERYKLEV